MKDQPVTKPQRDVMTTTTSFALWNLGFRPFYLLASLFGVISVSIWTLQYSGYLPDLKMYGPMWHAHEMLFGYTIAVIAGFLLTAVRVWTNQPTPSGIYLIMLVALWVCGRIFVLTSMSITTALVNAAFPIAIAVAIGIPILKTRNIRNYFFIGLLLLLGILIFTVNLALQGQPNLSPQLSLQLALDIVLFIMVVMAGRVIPMFTNNGVPGANARRYPLLENAALGSVILLLTADLLQLPRTVIAIIVLLCALAHAMRLFLWKPWRTLSTPLVWILHAAYTWIVIYLVLRGLSALDFLHGAYATHALTVGAIGGLTLGMMTRTARGHTARPLIADGFEITMFLLIQIAAVVRVFGGVVSSELYLASIQLSGLLWSLAFGLYLVRYWPILTRPRLDGKPG